MSKKKAAPADRPKPPTPPRTLTPDEADVYNKLLIFAQGEPDSGTPPLKVQFTAELYETDAAVKPHFEWTFDDASPASHERNPTHVYRKIGTYLATVRVTDATGRSGQDEVMIYVGEPWEWGN